MIRETEESDIPERAAICVNVGGRDPPVARLGFKGITLQFASRCAALQVQLVA